MRRLRKNLMSTISDVVLGDDTETKITSTVITDNMNIHVDLSKEIPVMKLSKILEKFLRFPNN